MMLVKHGTSEFDAARGGMADGHRAPWALQWGSGIRVVLASQSPRRRELLAERGLAFEVCQPGFEDDHLRRGGRPLGDPMAERVRPEEWVVALAYLKARATLQRLVATSPNQRLVVIGADTVVAKAGTLIGKAACAKQASEILHRLADGEHAVITGAAILSSVPGLLSRPSQTPTIATRILLADRARVRVGAISPEQIAGYVASDSWKGKAGAYNLAERLAAGWPISLAGDPATVMGFPIQRTAVWIDALVAIQRQATEAGSEVGP